MKKLFTLLLFTIISLVSFAQKHLTRNDIQKLQRGETYDLEKVHDIVYMDNIAYSKNYASHSFKNYEIMSLDVVDTISNGQIVVYDSEYIVFRNLDTDALDIIIDVRPILKNALQKQIFSNKVRYLDDRKVFVEKQILAMVITSDFQNLIFSTSTNTYNINLKSKEFSELKLGDPRQPSIKYIISPDYDIVVKNDVVVFNTRKYVEGGSIPIKDKVAQYDVESKNFKIIR